MHQKILFPVLLVLIAALRGSSQTTDSLQQLQHEGFAAYHSAGSQERARNIVSLIDSAISYHHDLLGFRPAITLWVLNTSDWTTYTHNLVVYGMPHYNEKTRTLIVAADDNPFWKSFLPPIDQMPAGLRQQVTNAYSTGTGELSMRPFFDLLAIHELGHAFHFQAALTMQRQWLGELFCNILLHTFIAEKAPALLQALVVFPRMVVAAGTRGFKYTSLRDVEERYNELGREHPRNYGWYQCRWHTAAAEIYDTGGAQACLKLWNALKERRPVMNDKDLAAFLLRVESTTAGMMLSWDKQTIKQ